MCPQLSSSVRGYPRVSAQEFLSTCDTVVTLTASRASDVAAGGRVWLPPARIAAVQSPRVSSARAAAAPCVSPATSRA